MTSAYASKLGLQVYRTDVEAQKIDGRVGTREIRL